MSANLTLLWPGLETDTADYTASLDDTMPRSTYTGLSAYERDRKRHLIREQLGPNATIAEWDRACKAQGL